MNDPSLIHGAVARQAAATPDAIAVVTRHERVSYAELDAAADACAAELQYLGAGPGDLLPVLLPRSAQLVAVLLGVLKSGAGYAALDHRWPPERIRSVLETLKPPLFITRETVPGDLVPSWAPPAEGPRWTARRCPRPAPPELTGDAPAAVFFTSGTSGVPKAVVSPHRATTRLAPDATAWTGPGRTMVQAAPVSWDAFSLETWGPLITGGRCAMADGDFLLPAELRRLISARGADAVFLTTSLFNLLVDEDLDCFRGLRTVLTGGERMSLPHVRRCLTAHPRLALTNCYGPVESCVFVSTQPVGAAECATPGGVPLGTAVSATGVHILSGDRPAPPGTVGEICVSGQGLALEYLGDPRLTAEKFPTVRVGGADTRVYRTGDRGLLDQNGVLHFRGRGDRQVKIAGHRVEPQEIETVCRRIPGVRECAVAALPDENGGGARLALFYTVEPVESIEPAGAPGRRDLTPAALRRALTEVLPHYLVPHFLSRQPAFPLTPNGKVDQAALSALLTTPPVPANRSL
ncbi:AMP-binding protein [Streptomyces jumonjinensis]|uniref:Chemotaxis protein CheR n=1 Tax=Streptomyces jumonjinensis TaxID=1945 RepID=A0A646KUC7_STRJU|nr:AMP-binding protein [Streptomyces jumonjinensis]MQT05637.1 chemotaxis protein CheR [Streptomyces jumonjinensis]